MPSSTIDPTVPAGGAPISAVAIRKQFGLTISDINALYALINALEVGSGVGTFVYTQTTPAATWVITHSLVRFPAVAVVDSTGRLVEGDIIYDTSNQVTLTFSGAFSGIAYLN